MLIKFMGEQFSGIGKKQNLKNIILFDWHIGSTNSYLMKIRLSGTVAAARVQKEGKGKHGARWISAEGGLWFSFLIRKKIKIPYMYVVLSSVAVADTLKSYGVKPVIKWPNDVLVSGKKICGILIENNHYESKIVTGIGVNINNDVPSGGGINAVSLSRLLGAKTDIDKFFISLIRRIDKNLAGLKDNRARLIASWIKYQGDISGRKIKLMSGGRQKTYTALKATKKGTVLTEEGRELKGEVFFL